jgi:copper(I)-binding protein
MFLLPGRIALVSIVLLTMLAACAPLPAAGSPIAIESAWARSAPAAADTAAFYLTIRNSGAEPDALIGARSAACRAAELHESYQAGSGMMGMRPAPGGSIALPARDKVELKPGGLHIMCIGKQAEFRAGVTLSLTLHFQKAGDQTVEVEIRE